MKSNIWLYFLGICLFSVSFIFDKIVVNSVVSIRNPILDTVFVWITHIGSVYVVLIFLILLFLLDKQKREWLPTVIICFFVMVAVVYLFKYLIMMPRPFEVMNIINLVVSTSPSFPSTHTAGVFVALSFFHKFFFKFRWIWLVFALLVGFSRIYTGVHYLSDVIFGALLGYAIGSLFVYLEVKYKPFKRLIFWQ